MKKLRLFIFLAVLCVAAAVFFFVMLPSFSLDSPNPKRQSLPATSKMGQLH